MKFKSVCTALCVTNTFYNFFYELAHGPSSAELVELQYEVMNLSFQQEVVAKVADKTSSAVQTLVKNQ